MRIGFFDMLIYRLFFWRWNRILWENDDMRRKFLGKLMTFESLKSGGEVTATITPVPESEASHD